MKTIELETPIEEMSEADLRETFSEVMEAHEANATEFAELQEDAGKATEYSETIEALEADVTEAAGYFARKASDVTNLSEDVLVDRFSIDELVELAGKADEAATFSEEDDCGVDGCDGPDDCTDPDADDCADDGDSGSVFAEKPQKSPKFSDGKTARREAAKARLSRLGGISVE